MIDKCFVRFLQLMGNNQKRSQKAIQQGARKQGRLLNPLQRWISSDQSIQDVISLFKTNQSFSSSSNAINQFLKSIVNKEKYQSYILGLLQYLGEEQAIHRFGDYQRKELYTHLFKKLRFSFFVRQDFNEGAINYSLSPVDMFELLYENIQSNQQMTTKAIAFNIDSILQGFKQFIQTLVELEIIVSKQQNLLSLIIPYSKIQGARLSIQINAISLIDDERANILQNLQLSNYTKQFYIQGFKELLKYDYADLTSTLFKHLKVKGYWLSQQELIQQLKIEIYCLYLYNHCKLSFSYDWIQSQTIRQIIHHFYTNFQLEDTAALIKCFNVFQDANQKWHQYILDYLFSEISLTTTMIRLFQKKYITFNNSQQQFARLLQKLRKCRTDIGKLSFQLSNLIQSFDIKNLEKIKYNKLIKLVEICYYFGIQQEVNFLYKIVYNNWEKPTHQQLINIQTNGLTLLKSLIANYFSKFDIKMKIITIQDSQFQFSTIFQMFKFIQYVKKYFLNDFINNCVTHQIFFCELIKNERYIEIKALLSDEKQRLFNIQLQTIQMIVIDHLIKLITKTKIKKNQESIKILLNIVKLQNANPVSGFHYVLSYYYYFKHLEDKDIVLPEKMKQKVSVQILYYIVDHYPEKIESVDFNYLFTHQSCISNHHTDINVNFIAVVTDQFLKFKIYLCRKAFFQRKINLGNEAIQEVIRCQPPWISTQLVKILKQNPNVSSEEKKFVQIAFNYCAKGSDLQYILNLYSNVKQSKRNSFLKISSSWTTILKQDKYLLLTQQIVLNQALYKNHVAERTFSYNEDKNIKSNNYLFFYMMTVEPDQAFNYAINYNMPVDFVVDFMIDGAQKGVFHLTNILPVTLRYLCYQLMKEEQNLTYISFKDYKKPRIQQLSDKSFKVRSQTYYHFQKIQKNYKVSKIITQQFIDLYLNPSILFNFMHDEVFRKKVLVDLRQQPMSKNNSKILKSLCQKAKIDILELSIYNLMSKVNSKETLDDECWTICQKFIYWGEQKQIALNLVKKLSSKIEILQILVNIFDYLRESQPTFKLIITDYHLDIIRSLAAVEVQKNLHGIIPEDYFQREIGPFEIKQRGKLSENHRKILEKQARVQNIFVISKALYFMYGCNEEIEKIILGQFSLKQNDSQEFQILRKKIKNEKF